MLNNELKAKTFAVDGVCDVDSKPAAPVSVVPLLKNTEFVTEYCESTESPPPELPSNNTLSNVAISPVTEAPTAVPVVAFMVVVVTVVGMLPIVMLPAVAPLKSQLVTNTVAFGDPVAATTLSPFDGEFPFAASKVKPSMLSARVAGATAMLIEISPAPRMFARVPADGPTRCSALSASGLASNASGL